MEFRSNSSISDSDLYELAGRSYTASLGCETPEQLSETASYFYACLSSDTIEAFRLSERLSACIHDAPPTYGGFVRRLLESLSLDDTDEDVPARLDRARLLAEVDTQAVFSTEFSLHDADDILRIQLSCRLMRQGGAVYGLFLLLDVTEVYHANARLLHKVEYDGLTELYDRSAGARHIRCYLEQAPEESSAIAIIDLDFFKRFNDQFGHEVGDRVLCDAARSLERHFARDSIIVRNGGDEFLVLLKGRTVTEAEDELTRFSRTRHGIEIDGIVRPYTFSIGYVMCPEQGRDVQDLIMKADVAMYSVKMDHRDGFVRYDPSMLLQKRTQLSFNLADIVSGIPGAILVYKAHGREEILFANDQLYQLFECESMEELLEFSGDSFKNIVHSDDLERVEKSIWRQIHANPFGLDYVSYRIITKTGKIRMIDDIGHLVHTPKYGDIFYVFLYDQKQRQQILEDAGEPFA